MTSPIEELQEQRDFLLANTWVPHAPRQEGTGCLIARRPHNGGFISLGAIPTMFIAHAVGVTAVTSWNDSSCKGSGEAIGALERAIAIAKARDAKGTDA